MGHLRSFHNKDWRSPTSSPATKALLASQESSTMVSTWNEYLRLDKKDHSSAVLEICQYEVLGEMQYDEEGNRTLPPEIDPEDVVGLEDGFIVGGVLACGDDQSFLFTTETIPEAVEWLKENGWKCNTKLLAELAKAVRAPTSKTKTTPGSK
jgi:hypothetical protein